MRIVTRFQGGHSRNMRGFTLIEMMVAVVLGIIVSGGIISLFASTSKASRVQTSLARVQEAGRFVMSTLATDMRMINSQYCSSTGGKSHRQTDTSLYQPELRSPSIMTQSLVMSDGTVPTSAASATGTYSMPSALFLRGYNCASGTCTPSVPTGVAPAAGITAGARVMNTDVLTMRFLSGTGWALDLPTGGSSQQGTNALTGITLDPLSGEPPAAYFEDGDLAMLVDCSLTQVFEITGEGSTALSVDTAAGANFPLANVSRVLPENAGRLYNFSKDYLTVTYYVQLQPDDDPDAAAGHLVGVLMRKVNQQPAVPVVRGVERLDFRYLVENNLGDVAYLDAGQIAGGSLACPPGPPLPVPGGDVGCLWRSVQAIEVSTLLNSINRGSFPDGELGYAYLPDGAGLQMPPNTMSNGLDRNMMRRGFTSLVSVRNYNP